MLWRNTAGISTREGAASTGLMIVLISRNTAYIRLESDNEESDEDSSEDIQEARTTKSVVA